ncbi:unnamed protein product [Closterium sp. NIES-53]
MRALLAARDLRHARVQLAPCPHACCPHALCLHARCLRVLCPHARSACTRTAYARPAYTRAAYARPARTRAAYELPARTRAAYARPALVPVPHCPAARVPPCPAARALPCPAAHAPPCLAACALPCHYSDYRYCYATTAVASDALAPLLLTVMANITVVAASGGGQQQQQCQPETLSPQQLHEWVVRRGRSGPRAWDFMHAGGTGQQRRSRYGTGGTGQQRQQRQQETLSPQQLREWVSQQRVPDSAEATSLGGCEPGSTGAVSMEALHTFTLDPGATRCFFCDFTTVTPLTTPVPVSLADPSGGPVVARASTVLPCSCVGSISCVLFVSATLAPDSPLAPPSWSPLPTPPCLSCVEGRQRAAPHSSFPPTTAPLQTLHMDVWGPARVRGQDQERYFLLVVDDYTRYTTIFPLRSKADLRGALIDWITAVRHQLSAQFQQDLPVLRLHYDRGGEFSSGLIQYFCRAEGIAQSFTLLASPQKNEISERRISLVMEVARTSMVHAAAPHFLWPFAVRYSAHQLNLWLRVSVPETLPTLRWTGEVGDASAFRVWGALSLVRDTTTGKLSPRTLCNVFLGFPTEAPPWQFLLV